MVRRETPIIAAACDKPTAKGFNPAELFVSVVLIVHTSTNGGGSHVWKGGEANKLARAAIYAAGLRIRGKAFFT